MYSKNLQNRIARIYCDNEQNWQYGFWHFREKNIRYNVKYPHQKRDHRTLATIWRIEYESRLCDEYTPWEMSHRAGCKLSLYRPKWSKEYRNLKGILADHCQTDRRALTEWGSDRWRKGSRVPSLELLDPRYPHHLYTRYGSAYQDDRRQGSPLAYTCIWSQNRQKESLADDRRQCCNYRDMSENPDMWSWAGTPRGSLTPPTWRWRRRGEYCSFSQVFCLIARSWYSRCADSSAVYPSTQPSPSPCSRSRIHRSLCYNSGDHSGWGRRVLSEFVGFSYIPHFCISCCRVIDTFPFTSLVTGWSLADTTHPFSMSLTCPFLSVWYLFQLWSIYQPCHGLQALLSRVIVVSRCHHSGSAGMFIFSRMNKNKNRV